MKKIFYILAAAALLASCDDGFLDKTPLDKLSEEELIHRLEKENQALCILNTKKRTQKIYQEMNLK